MTTPSSSPPSPVPDAEPPLARRPRTPDGAFIGARVGALTFLRAGNVASGLAKLLEALRAHHTARPGRARRPSSICVSSTPNTSTGGAASEAAFVYAREVGALKVPFTYRSPSGPN
jgi:hypothetical protein